MDGSKNCHAKSDREGEISYDIPYVENLKRYDINEIIYITETDSSLDRQTLYSQQRNTWSWLWLRSYAPDCKTQAQIEDFREKSASNSGMT